MQKPYNVLSLKDEKEIAKLDNLLTILFKGAQGKEIRTMDFADTGVWPTAGSIAEKELVFANNAIDGLRIYTKISGVLKFVAFS